MKFTQEQIAQLEKLCERHDKRDKELLRLLEEDKDGKDTRTEFPHALHMDSNQGIRLAALSLLVCIASVVVPKK